MFTSFCDVWLSTEISFSKSLGTHFATSNSCCHLGSLAMFLRSCRPSRNRTMALAWCTRPTRLWGGIRDRGIRGGYPPPGAGRRRSRTRPGLRWPIAPVGPCLCDPGTTLKGRGPKGPLKGTAGEPENHWGNKGNHWGIRKQPLEMMN